LYCDGDLIGGMSLSKHHRNNVEMTLNRLCFRKGFQIVGGASKLLSHCKEWAKTQGYSKIISWSDNRWSSGNVYEKMGFKLEKDLPPDYSYVYLKGKAKRYSKQSKKKSNTGCPKDKTEVEWMTELGYARIWDCGKKRWVFKI
jgi:hypothetical protein